MQSTREIIILLLLLFSINFLNVFAQKNNCEPSCSKVDVLLSPCNTSLRRPNPGEIATVQFGALEAKCYCSQETYNRIRTCSACVNVSGENKRINLEDLEKYKSVCATFGVTFKNGSETVSSTPTDNSKNNSTDEPQINNNIPNYSYSSNSLTSYIILGVVVGIPVLIIFIIFITKCFKRRKTDKITYDKQNSQVDLADDSSIISRLQVYQQQHTQTQYSIERDDLTEISIDSDRVNNNIQHQRQQYNNYNDIQQQQQYTGNNNIQQQQQQQYKFRKNY